LRIAGTDLVLVVAPTVLSSLGLGCDEVEEELGRFGCVTGHFYLELADDKFHGRLTRMGVEAGLVDLCFKGTDEGWMINIECCMQGKWI